MTPGRLEVADVIRQQGARYQARFGPVTSAAQRQVLAALLQCRTAALGGHREKCDRCGHERLAYNSCRDRHCPKCQGKARAQWLQARSQELLPVPYFHVVFTLPSALCDLALANRKVVYELLFQAAAQTLLTIAADPSHLGARIGFLAVLHTWGQNLMLHPHLHCLIPGGGLSHDSSRWIFARPRFFLPVRVLSRLFRTQFCRGLKRACQQGHLTFHGRATSFASPPAFAQLLHQLRQQEWVVYAKPPFGGPAQTLKYLARYTHRVAIANHRLLKMDLHQVTFRWKDYRHHRHRTMTLEGAEFLRRFLLHLWPPGFVHIRHYGFLANRCRRSQLARCRELLAAPEPPQNHSHPSGEDHSHEHPAPLCPVCREGHMLTVEILAPAPRSPPPIASSPLPQQR